MSDVTVMIVEGSSTSGWDYDGYQLTRVVKEGVPYFCVTCISHCSCDSEDNSYDEDEHTLTAEKLLELAEAGADPRVPDVEMGDEHLKAIYTWVLWNEDKIGDPEWMPKCAYKIQPEEE